MKSDLIYKVNTPLEIDEVLALYHHCALGTRRPLDDKARMQAMINNASLVITAWSGNKLIGIARCLTDFVYVAYLADLAIHEDYQKQGIGKQLVKEVQNNMGKQTKIILLAAPSAVGYYPNLGFEQHDQAWVLSKD